KPEISRIAAIGVAPSPSRFRMVRPERPIAAGMVIAPNRTMARLFFPGAGRTTIVDGRMPRLRLAFSIFLACLALPEAVIEII
ncbi:hypothetical protein, partial [Mesorhizobium sp. M1A.T.Ca.IN.004.03.1.1]|uniref:hypothetical protein n=1 Tax=Mesorhizobium sp. M1A.T.Ca.IN.004.03.1.1 TaxID=2496795 RepID=UPI0013E2A8F6